MTDTELSHRWRYGVGFVALAGLAVLIWITAHTYSNDVGAPIPARVADIQGQTVFTGEDIIAGQQVFQKYGLMENGSIWGHGALSGTGLFGGLPAPTGAGYEGSFDTFGKPV